MKIRFGDDIGAADRSLVTALLAHEEFGFLRADPVISVLPGGASNQNFLVKAGGVSWVLRHAEPGVERFRIDRPRGLAAHQAASAAGLAPELAAVKEPEGHCAYRFIEGEVLDAAALRGDGVLDRLGRTLRLIHASGPIAGRWSVFDDIRGYIRLARAERLALPDDIDDLLSVAEGLEAALTSARIPDRLCHNDLQPQNVIVGGKRMWVIDWEYGAMGNPYFDLGGICVNGRLDADEQDALLAAYFGTPKPVDRARVAAMTYASALREATWAVIAGPVLAAIDWDYEAWAAEFFERARERRSFTSRLGIME